MFTGRRAANGEARERKSSVFRKCNADEENATQPLAPSKECFSPPTVETPPLPALPREKSLGHSPLRPPRWISFPDSWRSSLPGEDLPAPQEVPAENFPLHITYLRGMMLMVPCIRDRGTRSWADNGTPSPRVRAADGNRLIEYLELVPRSTSTNEPPRQRRAKLLGINLAKQKQWMAHYRGTDALECRGDRPRRNVRRENGPGLGVEGVDCVARESDDGGGGTTAIGLLFPVVAPFRGPGARGHSLTVSLLVPFLHLFFLFLVRELGNSSAIFNVGNSLQSLPSAPSRFSLGDPARSRVRSSRSLGRPAAAIPAKLARAFFLPSTFFCKLGVRYSKT